MFCCSTEFAGRRCPMCGELAEPKPEPKFEDILFSPKFRHRLNTFMTGNPNRMRFAKDEIPWDQWK